MSRIWDIKEFNQKDAEIKEKPKRTIGLKNVLKNTWIIKHKFCNLCIIIV